MGVLPVVAQIGEDEVTHQTSCRTYLGVCAFVSDRTQRPCDVVAMLLELHMSTDQHTRSEHRVLVTNRADVPVLVAYLCQQAA